MLIQDQDFAVETKAGFPRCLPKTPNATSAYKTLQLLLIKLVAQIPGPKPTVAVDGAIGPSTVLAVQLIAGRFAEGKHPALVELASAQPEEAIPYVAQNAMEIADLFGQIAATDQTALASPQSLEAAQPQDPIEMLKGFATVPRIAALSFGLLGLTGLALAAHAGDKRGAGLVDRSRFLPESDGSDEFDDGSDDDGEGDEQEEEQGTSQEADESAHAA
jgi:hypothetical protein